MIFFVFYRGSWCWWSWWVNCDFSMNMGSWRLSIQRIGRKRRQEQRCEGQVQGWFLFFPSWKYSSCLLEKMAWWAHFLLMLVYGNQGQWWRRRRWRRRQWGWERLRQKWRHMGWIISEGDGLVSRVIASVVIHIVGFLLYRSCFLFPLTYLHLLRRPLQTSFSQ